MSLIFDNTSYLKRWHSRICSLAQEMGLEVKCDRFYPKGSRIQIEECFVYFKTSETVVTLELVSADGKRMFIKRYNLLNNTKYTYKLIGECLNNIKTQIIT